MKVCSRCKVNKSLSDFSTNPRYRLGVTGHCKKCKAEVSQLHALWNSTLPKPAIANKACSRCHEIKSTDEFTRNNTTRDGYSGKCKQCRSTVELRRRMNPESALRARLKHGYGMTCEDLYAMIESQRGRCAICEETFAKPVIDHDHETGVVRALLCSRCNASLAAIERPGFVDRARAYLQRHRAEPPRFRVNARWFAQRERLKAEQRDIQNA